MLTWEHVEKAEEWHREWLVREAAPELLVACELFRKYDAEECTDETTPYEIVKAAVLAALKKAGRP